MKQQISCRTNYSRYECIKQVQVPTGSRSRGVRSGGSGWEISPQGGGGKERLGW